jgi:hypothetical protein
MKPDVKKLLSYFELGPKVKNGDLVLVAEVMRVTDAKWGASRYHPDSYHKDVSQLDIGVVDVFPQCRTCGPGRECIHEHIVSLHKCGGQHRVMRLKGGRR